MEKEDSVREVGVRVFETEIPGKFIATPAIDRLVGRHEGKNREGKKNREFRNVSASTRERVALSTTRRANVLLTR